MAYNFTGRSKELLKKYADAPFSLSVQLYPDYWTLNSGPKFLYNSPQATELLDEIRAHRIPADLLETFDQVKLLYYEGCLIVEIQDFRTPLKVKDRRLTDETKPQLETTRTVLYPTGESIWADICLMNAKAGGQWSDRDTIDIESKILLATSEPLCLDPDPKLGRIANRMARVSRPRSPPALRPNKRKISQADQTEVDEVATARRMKLFQFRNPQMARPKTPNFKLLETFERVRAAGGPEAASTQATSAPPQNLQTPQQPTHINTQLPSSVNSRPSSTIPQSAQKVKSSRSNNGTPTPTQNTPVSATPHLQPQMLHQGIRPSPRPPSQSPHPKLLPSESNNRPAPSPAPHHPPVASPRQPPVATAQHQPQQVPPPPQSHAQPQAPPQPQHHQPQHIQPHASIQAQPQPHPQAPQPQAPQAQAQHGQTAPAQGAPYHFNQLTPQQQYVLLAKNNGMLPKTSGTPNSASNLTPQQQQQNMLKYLAQAQQAQRMNPTQIAAAAQAHAQAAQVQQSVARNSPMLAPNPNGAMAVAAAAAAQQQAMQRGSPLVANKQPIATRSPIPNANGQQQQQHQQHPNISNVHPSTSYPINPQYAHLRNAIPHTQTQAQAHFQHLAAQQQQQQQQATSSPAPTPQQQAQQLIAAQQQQQQHQQRLQQQQRAQQQQQQQHPQQPRAPQHQQQQHLQPQPQQQASNPTPEQQQQQQQQYLQYTQMMNLQQMQGMVNAGRGQQPGYMWTMPAGYGRGAPLNAQQMAQMQQMQQNLQQQHMAAKAGRGRGMPR